MTTKNENKKTSSSPSKNEKKQSLKAHIIGRAIFYSKEVSEKYYKQKNKCKGC